METSLNNGANIPSAQATNGLQNSHPSEPPASVPPQLTRMGADDEEEEEEEDEGDLHAGGNPEQSFIPTSYRLDFDGESGSGSSSSCSSPSRSASPAKPVQTTAVAPIIEATKSEPMEVDGESVGEKSAPTAAQIKDPRKRPANASPVVNRRPTEVVRSRDEWKEAGGGRRGREQSDDETVEGAGGGGGGRFSMQQSREDDRWRKRRDDRSWAGEMDRAGRSRANVWAGSPTSRELEEVYVLQERHEKRVAAEWVLSGKKGTEASSAKSPERKKRKRSVSSSSSASSSSSSAACSSRGRKSGKRRKGKRSRDNSENRRHKHSKRHKKKDKKGKHRKEREEEKGGKKHKQRRRRSPSPTSSSSRDGSQSGDRDEWVELTNELRAEEAMKTRKEEAQVIGPQLPEHLLQEKQKGLYGQSTGVAGEVGKLDAQDRKHMLKGEAAAYAAYAAQGKRIPRRGEIGLSSNEISVFEKVGYVMSGTRHRAMEATRLRKENQIMTADEKRLLNTFTSEQRQTREETVLKQFQQLITSKKSKK